MSEYPEEWQLSTLADVGEWKGGGTPSKANPSYWRGEIPWVSPKDMKDDLISSSEDSISELAISESSASLIKAGAILVVTRSGILRHTLPLALAGRDLAINQDLKAITVKPSIDCSFVFHYMRRNSLNILDSCMKSGTTVESIETSQLKNFHIPLPPLAEQKKIAAILSGIDNAIEKLKKKNAKYQSLLASMRHEVFNEESANIFRFEQVVLERVLGTTRRGAGNGENIPLVKMGDITRGDIKLGENERIQYGEDLHELLLQRGDILFNTRNTPALVGKTAIYDSETRCTYDNNLMRIRVTPGNDAWYLNHLMNSPQFLQLLTRITAGTTSVAAIYWNDLRRLEIPLPSISRQKQIAKSIQSVLFMISELSREICCLGELKNAISFDLLSGRKRVSI